MPGFFPALAGGPEAVTFMDTFGPNGAVKDRKKSDILAAFKQPNTAPFVLVYVAAAAPYGQSLCPASIVLLVDHVWEASKIYQAIARVRRSQEVQKARRTESYRFIVEVEGCPWSEWMADRQATLVEVREKVTA